MYKLFTITALIGLGAACTHSTPASTLKPELFPISPFGTCAKRATLDDVAARMASAGWPIKHATNAFIQTGFRIATSSKEHMYYMDQDGVDKTLRMRITVINDRGITRFRIDSRTAIEGPEGPVVEYDTVIIGNSKQGYGLDNTARKRLNAIRAAVCGELSYYPLRPQHPPLFRVPMPRLAPPPPLPKLQPPPEVKPQLPKVKI